MKGFKLFSLYLGAFTIALIGLILLAPVLNAQTPLSAALPVCFAKSTDTVTDGQNLTRAANYQCPASLLTTSTPNVYHRAFFLVVTDPPLDNATLQFSRRLPIVKDTGGTALDPINSGDLRPGFYYLVTWRGEDHQIHPTFWRTPLQVAMYTCANPVAPCERLEAYVFKSASGRSYGPYYLYATPVNFNLDPKIWTLYQ